MKTIWKRTQVIYNSHLNMSHEIILISFNWTGNSYLLLSTSMIISYDGLLAIICVIAVKKFYTVLKAKFKFFKHLCYPSEILFLAVKFFTSPYFERNTDFKRKWIESLLGIRCSWRSCYSIWFKCSGQNTLREEIFAGRKFRSFRGFGPLPRNFLPAKFLKTREPRN